MSSPIRDLPEFEIGQRVRVTMDRSTFTGYIIGRGRLLLPRDHSTYPTGPWRYLVQNDAGNVHEYGARAMAKIASHGIYRRRDDD